MTVVGVALVAVGGVALAVGNVLEKYHSRQFAAHTERLQRASPDRDAIDRELRRFHDDSRVDWAIHGMTVCHIGGVLLLFVGAFLLIGGL